MNPKETIIRLLTQNIGVPVTASWPGEKLGLPLITVTLVNSSIVSRSDDKPDLTQALIQVDIWTAPNQSPWELAARVTETLAATDMFPENERELNEPDVNRVSLELIVGADIIRP